MAQLSSDITECCICDETVTDPRILPCIHTFCLKCLEATVLKSEKNPGDRMPCLVCKTEFTIPPDGLCGLQKNFFMERLVEIENVSKTLKTTASCDVCLTNKEDGDCEVPDASKYCVECRENMCENCSVQHKRQKLCRDHQILALGSELEDELVKVFIPTSCTQHNKEELKMYCVDCKSVICMMCFAENHQMHKCSDVNKVADVFKDEIGVFQAKVVECSRERLAQEFKLEQEKRNFFDESDIAEHAIKARANALKQLIDKHTKILLEELVQKKATRVKDTDHKSEEIDRYLAVVNGFGEYCGEIKSKGTSTDICRSFHDLRARASELQEQRPIALIKPDTSARHVSFKSSAIEDILKVKVENIVGSLEVSIEFMERLQCPLDVQAITKLGDNIYVLCRQKILPLFDGGSGTMTCIIADRYPFEVCRNIHIREISWCQDAVASNKFKCLYVSDSLKKCVWKLTVEDFRVAQWLTLESDLRALSVSTDGHLLLLRDDKGVNRLEIYGSHAKVIRSIPLSSDVMSPGHIVQVSHGHFIVIHESHDSRRGLRRVVSEISSEGDIIGQFQSKELTHPFHLSLDSESGRLFVAQMSENKFSIVTFDLRSLEWKQILLKDAELLPRCCPPVHYDKHKRQLLVGNLRKVTVYQIC